MLDEGYENFSSPGYIASHQHGFIRIFIADFSIFFPQFIFLFICFILFSHRVLLMEYLKYGHKLGFWEGLGYKISPEAMKIVSWLKHKIWAY